MTVNEWLSKLKLDKPALSDFIQRIEPFVNDGGLNVQEFEKKVAAGITKIEKETETAYNP